MKRIPLESVSPLAAHLKNLAREPVVLISNGRAVAAVVALPNTDAESASLATNPLFLALIERSRRRVRRAGAMASDEVRKRLAASKPRPARKSTPR
ncbi:hypothetical protein RAS1_01780 [Phycisphaerae bacterium RAS1]|nr:hypothetical protein RAS1_01780 [Phycisphaerae bacterium RAS1]